MSTGLLKLFAGKGLLYGLPVMLAALIASHAWAHHSGVLSERGRQAIVQRAALEQAIKTKDALQARNDAIAAEHSAKAQERRVIYRTITREVAAHAASTAAAPCIDAIGMRIIRAAARGELPDPATGPDRELP